MHPLIVTNRLQYSFLPISPAHRAIMGGIFILRFGLLLALVALELVFSLRAVAISVDYYFAGSAD